MNFFSKTNKLLEYLFSIRIQRQPKKQYKSKSGIQNKGGENLIIEFVGVQGSGKSHLFNYYLKKCQSKSGINFLTKKELRKFKPYLCSKTGLHLSGFHNDILSFRFQELADKRIKGDQKVRRLNQLLPHLVNDYVASCFLNNEIIIFDEHLLHYCKSLTSYLSENSETREFLKNRIFIFCDLSTAKNTAYLTKKIKKKAFG